MLREISVDVLALITPHTAERYRDIKPWQKHGSLYHVFPARTGNLRPVGEWNEQEVTARGSRVRVVLNGATILDVDTAGMTDPKRRRLVNGALTRAVSLLLMAQKVPQGELPRKVGVSPYFLKGLMQQAGRFDSQQYRRVFNRFLEADLALKSTGGEPRMQLERLLLEITDMSRKK